MTISGNDNVIILNGETYLRVSSLEKLLLDKMKIKIDPIINDLRSGFIHDKDLRDLTDTILCELVDSINETMNELCLR
jgi:hypothetical protein